MKRIKVSEATPIQLDWLVAKCEGFDTRNDCIVEYMNKQDSDDVMEFVCMADDEDHARDQLTDAYPESTFVSAYWQEFKITADWSFCGPIVEKEGINVVFQGDYHDWVASKWNYELEDWELYEHGETPLIAVCRCYVASKLGEMVEVPEELT